MHFGAMFVLKLKKTLGGSPKRVQKESINCLSDSFETPPLSSLWGPGARNLRRLFPGGADRNLSGFSYAGALCAPTDVHNRKAILSVLRAS